MSIRFRLTLLYSTILALTLIVFGAAVYLTLSRSTMRVLQDQLADEARSLTASRVFRLDRIILPNTRLAAPQTFVQTRSIDGQISSQTPNLIGLELPLSQDDFETVRDGTPVFRTKVVQGERLLIYDQPVNIGDQTVGIIQVARSLAEQDQSLWRLRQFLIVGSSIATVFAFGIGWLLAGTALYPIKRITQTARAIGAERDFTRRVNYAGPPDEVGRLATTFNEMLTELQAAYQHLEQALQAQRRFVADASHELRTPLTTIRGNTALLQRDPPIAEEDRVEVLADMVDETDRLIRLVNNLLALARADAGRPLRHDPVRLQPLIEDLCREVKLLEPHRIIRCDDLQDVAVAGDRDAIKQILVILLDNARKFTPVDGLISIRTAATNERVSISVRDTGRGIEPAALPHIFDRFYRGDPARTGEGAGLGLAIAKTLVEAQHGTLSVESELGRGSVFTVTLPRVTGDDVEEDELVLSTSVHNGKEVSQYATDVRGRV